MGRRHWLYDQPWVEKKALGKTGIDVLHGALPSRAQGDNARSVKPSPDLVFERNAVAPLPDTATLVDGKLSLLLVPPRFRCGYFAISPVEGKPTSSTDLGAASWSGANMACHCAR